MVTSPSTGSPQGIVEAPIPDQDPIGSMYVTIISIKLRLNFDHVRINSVMTRVSGLIAKSEKNERL